MPITGIKELKTAPVAFEYLACKKNWCSSSNADAHVCNMVNGTLRRIGFSKDEMTVHGFRLMVSTLLHENGCNSDVIERQLAHVENNSVKSAYNHAEQLEVRSEMMQWWAGYLEKLTEGL